MDSLLRVDIDVMHDMGYNRPDLVQSGEYYRLMTATILHAGLFHIAANTLGLLNLGTGVEANSLPWLYLTVYLVGGIQGISSITQATCSTMRFICTTATRTSREWGLRPPSAQ